MDNRDLPIGFFDSGLGGISVLKKAIQLMPEENYIYFGDSANAPYGEKNKEDIFRTTVIFCIFVQHAYAGLSGRENT